MAPSWVHRRIRRRLSSRKPKSRNSTIFIRICMAAFFVSIVGLWVCIMFTSPWQTSQPKSDMSMLTEPIFHRIEKKVEGAGWRSLRRNQFRHERLDSSNSRKPRVIGIYAYQLNEIDDWKNDRSGKLPPYMFLTERIDPYLLSHTSQTLRRLRSHDYYPDKTTLSDVMKNYKLAIVGSNSYIRSEDPLKHLMLSSASRDTLRGIINDSGDYEDAMATPLEDNECEATPKNSKWMLHAFPTCNIAHENDWVTSVRKSRTKILGSGYWRDVWPVLDSGPSSQLLQKKVALKTIRYEHDLTERNFHRHVRDAIVSERLTSSPIVTSIYTFCGNSGYFEFATGGSLSDRLSKHQMAVMENGDRGENAENDDDAEILDRRAKLGLAHQVAAGLADFHDADAMTDKNGKITSAAMVHADITVDQFINIGGVFKLNDFNRCRFMRRYRNSTDLGGDGKPCGFDVGNNPGKNRSPEEYAYAEETEKIDVYSMGNILYSILTDKDPWEGTSTKKVQKYVMRGDRPKVPSSIKASKEPVDVALRKMMSKCWEHKPEDRPRARTVADYLSEKLRQLDSDKKAIE